MSQNTSINAGSSNPTPQAVVRMEGNEFHTAGRDVVRNEYNEIHHHYNTGTAEGSPQGNPKKGKAKPKAPSGSRNRWLKAKVVMALFKLLKFVQFRRSFSYQKVIINGHSSMDFTFLSSIILENGTRRASGVPRKRSLPEIYSCSISKEYGCPLYQPYSDLSSELQRTCIEIGDVGVITPDGCFDPLFNVCSAHNRCRNPSKLPDDFEEVRSIEISRGQYNPFRLFSPGVLQIPPNSYTCTVDEGAVLELPVGASRTDARNSGTFRGLAARHALNWYKYLLIDRDIDARNGSLLIVSGYIKSRNWGIAVFDRPSTSEDYLHFIADENSDYQWSNSGPVLARVGADIDSHLMAAQDGAPNQCIFLRGYQIALPDKEWETLTQYSGVRSSSRDQK